MRQMSVDILGVGAGAILLV